MVQEGAAGIAERGPAARRAPVMTRLASARGRLVTVSAPAGYGKTDQVATWAAADDRPVAWVDVGAADDDTALVARVLRGLQDLRGGPPAAVADAPSTAEPAALAERLAMVRGAVAACTTPFILVLDDVHLLEAPASMAVLDALAGHVPIESSVVLVGRSAPAVALTRARVHQDGVDITAADLALDVAQAAGMLAAMGLALDGTAVGQIVRETEGWPVGVYLAGKALLDRPEPSADAIDGLVTHDPQVAAYLRAEWLRGVSDDDVELLTQLAILDVMSGPLCDDALERSGTAADLHRLHERHLLVTPVDPRNDTYRMHPLLRVVLEADLTRREPDAARRGHLRASRWLESKGGIDLALRHALAAGDLERAEQVVEANILAFQMRGHFATIARWLDAFPEGHLASKPSLCLAAAAAALGDAERDGGAVLAWLRTGEELLARTPDADGSLTLRFDAFRALIDTVSVGEAADAAARARDGLPPGIWHAVACLAHGAASFAVGDDGLAERLLTEAAAEAEVHGAATTVAVSRSHLAVLHSGRGDWVLAAPHVRAARSLVDAHHLEPYPTMVLVTAMAALLEATEGNPDRARDEWLTTRRSLKQMDGVAPWANIQARLALARTSLLLSDRAAARALLEETASLVLAQPDAIRPKHQLAELEALMDARAAKTRAAAYTLTAAELRVLHYLPTNLTLADIADRLYVSRNTAKSHATSIYRKLGTNRRGEAVEIAEAMGLLTATDGTARS